MARALRVEYEGARYHVMCRGNQRQTIFRSDADADLFIKTLGEMCVRDDVVVHAWCLMGNHYHLLLETPRGNLVSGMKWLQGTFTQRYNARHKLWGHLLNLSRWSLFPLEIIYRFAFGRGVTKPR